MKSFVLVLALAAVALGEPVKVAELPSFTDDIDRADAQALGDADQPSVYGYLTEVAVPLAKARKELEEAYFAQEAAQGRIAGGTPAIVGQFPWQAGLITDIIGVDVGNGVCGASLVSNNRLITAAHCWFDGINTAWRVTVVLGSVFLFGNDGVRVQSTDVILHPQWSITGIVNDIAVINLPTAVQFSTAISPISLPEGNELSEDFAGSTAIASGFGLTDDVSPGNQLTQNQFLSHVTVPVITNSVCWWSFPLLLTADNICIDGSGGRSTCRGDSGGPLVVFRNNRPVLIGVTSFGSARGCTIGRPAVFARITYFMDWLRQHL